MKLSDLNHSDESRHRRRAVQSQLANVHFGDCKVCELRLRYENEEKYQRDDGEHQHQNPDEETLVSAGTVDRVVMRRSLEWVKFGPGDLIRLRIRPADVAPHDVQNGSANERILDGAWKQKR